MLSWRWNRITDKKPPEETYVLVYNGGDYYILRWHKNKDNIIGGRYWLAYYEWRDKSDLSYCVSDNDYWIGFPAGPEVEEGDQRLKLCPYCEGEGRLTDYRDGEDGDQRFYVECVDCGCCGPEAWEPEEAIEEWNRRGGS